MVACFYLKGSIERDVAFNALPLTIVNFPESMCRTKKAKIPHTGCKDDIVSLRYNGYVRGVAKATKSKAFPHSIAIYLSTDDKYLALKLSSESIHICGANSEEMANLGAQSIINHILTVQSFFNFINEEKQKTKDVVDEIKRVTKGPNLLIPGNEECKARFDNRLIQPDPAVFNKFGPTEQKLASFLLQHAKELHLYSDYISKLDWLLNRTKICSPDLSIRAVTPIMINYNYKLNFTVNREALCQAFNGRGGFFARYDNALQHNVAISLPYPADQKTSHIRKRKTNPCHTFMVYQSGNVTQSGPNNKLMSEAFEKFKNIINEMQEKISAEPLSGVVVSPGHYPSPTTENK